MICNDKVCQQKVKKKTKVTLLDGVLLPLLVCLVIAFLTVKRLAGKDIYLMGAEKVTTTEINKKNISKVARPF